CRRRRSANVIRGETDLSTTMHARRTEGAMTHNNEAGARAGVMIVGSTTADLTTFSHRLPARGETIHGDAFTLVLGGKGANQAVAVGLAGADAHFVSCVGDDLFHDMVVESLSEAGVNIEHLRTVAGPTGI